MADPKNTDGAPPRSIHVEEKRTNWLAWLLLALGLLALLLALSRCHHKAAGTTAAVTNPAAASVQMVTLPGGAKVALEPKTLNYELQRYLASTDPAPRTFTFDKLNFDTNSSALRGDDLPTLKALTQILSAYPNAAVRLTGYADARGTDPANMKLGADRAAAVAKALTDGGIDPKRIATSSGGASNPVDTNATASGQFENRRTELTVTTK